MEYSVRLATFVAALGLLGAVGCGGSMSDDGGGNGGGDGNGSDEQTLTLELEGVPSAGEAFEWEGWLIVDGSPVSTGQFDVDSTDATTETFEVSASDAEAASKFVLTLEPASEDPGTPSKMKFVAGSISEGTATATIANEPAIGTDFSDASGVFLLNAPSSESAGYKNGIWFIDNSGDGMSAGLDLPSLPEGWIYEGWVVKDGPTTTGKFRDPAKADMDGAGPAGGSMGAPPFPGQDFAKEGMTRDLTSGYSAVVSVEPNHEDDPAAPFVLKPLKGEVTDAGKGEIQEMSVDTSNQPTVSVSLE